MELTGTRRRFFRIAPTQQVLPQLNSAYNTRVHSIDLIRGAIMIIMALDHVRDYFHEPAFHYDPTDLSKTSVAIFFTRFITHFCAPTFMLLSGTSAFLVGERKGKKALSIFLLTRGLWLVFLELTVVNFGWFFDFSYSNTGTLVIWALGMSMICLAALIHLPRAVIAMLSLIMIFGHNLLDGFQPPSGLTYMWSILHQPQVFPFKNITWYALYPLIPWIGVMAIGYCMGSWYNNSFDAAKRRRFLFQTGIACVVLFVALRFTNWYGDAITLSKQPSSSFTILSFLSLSKYPPSLLYLLATIGPVLIALSFTEKSNGWLSKQIQIIGRVPLFYYLVPIYLIHLVAMVAAQLTHGLSWHDMILTNWVSFTPSLQNGYGLNLLGTYAVWIGLIGILYFMCKWYDNYKRTHKQWWLSYL